MASADNMPLQSKSKSTSSPVQKRARQQLSCVPCRTGKLKCDRHHPCDQCSKRSREASCIYLPPPKKKPRRPVNTKDRISQLETLVSQLISHGQPSIAIPEGQSTSPAAMAVQGPTPESFPGDALSPKVSLSEEVEPRESSGQMKVSNGQTSYVGSAHWEAVLAGIGELKAALGAERDRSPSPDDDFAVNPGHDRLILGGSATVSKQYLLDSCPPKSKADKILWTFFDAHIPMSPAIHKPTFLVEYNRHYANPASTPVIWLALFFGVLAMGCEQAVFIGMPDDILNEENGRHYHRLCSEALILADITKGPQRYVIEALIMFLGASHRHTSDRAQLRLYLTLGMVLRLAMKMGYHRDPSNYPNLSPFDCEMRRRAWHLVYIFDVLLSFSVGLPDMIRQLQSDTKLPRNLLDTDFGPETKGELPPSRPFQELSSISYCIVKAGIAKVFARAAEISHAVERPVLKDVQALDEELDQVYGIIPDSLKFTTMEQTIMDPPPVIFNRFKLQLLFQKTRCVLFRRYLSDDCEDAAEEPYRQKCVDAAVKILGHLETVYEASTEGGRLRTLPYFLDTFSAHDFLLAAMVLCLELNRVRKHGNAQDAGTQWRIQIMKHLLETTHKVYTQPRYQSQRISEKAVKALEIILNKVRGDSPSQIPHETTEIRQWTRSLPLQTSGVDAQPPSTVANGAPDIGNGMLIDPGLSLQEPFGTMFETNSLNWQIWDNVVQEPSQAADGWVTQANLASQTGFLSDWGQTSSSFYFT